MKERIRLLRKELKLNQSEFGEKVGVKGNTIGNYELGLRNPSEAVIFSICREFNVNETWLRTGQGEMFIQISENDEYTKAAESIAQNNDIEIMSLLVEYWKLDDTSKTIFKNFLRNVSERINESSNQHMPNLDIPIPSEEELQKYVVNIDEIDENDPELHPDIRKQIIQSKKEKKTKKEIG